MANRHMKKYSTSLVIRKMQIKATRSYHHIPIRTTGIRKTRENKWPLRKWRNWNICALLMGVEIGTASMENSMEFP